MGWLFYHREKGESNLDHFRREFGCGDRLIDGATKNGVFYGALRTDKTTSGKEEVAALIVLIRWVPKDYYNFGYKDMDESMGVGEYGCPERILALLSPVHDIYTGDSAQWASDWRQGCYDNLAKAKESRKVKPGMTVRFKQAVKFRNGESLDTLVFEGRNNFRGSYGRRYRLTGWRKRDYEVVTA